MANFWLFCALTASVLAYLSASDKCEETISLCKLTPGGDRYTKLSQLGQKGDKGEIGKDGQKGENGDNGIKGPRGDIGFPGHDGFWGRSGIPGAPGLQGTKGDIGEMGLEGLIGRKGMRGDKGSKGSMGLLGRDGIPGLPGNQGARGITGISGMKGIQGDEGFSGSIGPPGTPGKQGSCPCPSPVVTLTEDFGTSENPAKVLCKASARSVKTGVYFVGPEPIKVKCVNRGNLTTLTCIEPLEHARPKIFTYDKRLWLSEIGLTLEDIYGISRDQLAWLQKRSNSAHQTIRYHCFNSNPFPRHDVNGSLLLLSWNDKTIGPMPTLTKPFFYSVPTENDWCAIESEWKYTDIELVSNSNGRVPVTDFFIRDVRPGVTQSVKIEHLNLCFD